MIAAVGFEVAQEPSRSWAAAIWLVPVYLLIRGSRLAWIFLVVLGLLFGATNLASFFSDGAGTESGRWVDLIRAVLPLSSAFAWLTPNVRRFFDLEQRSPDP